jgi:hypothetical protein
LQGILGRTLTQAEAQRPPGQVDAGFARSVFFSSIIIFDPKPKLLVFLCLSNEVLEAFLKLTRSFPAQVYVGNSYPPI